MAKLYGVRHLINVAGVDLREIYSAQDLSGFTIEQFEFADVFDNGNPVSGTLKSEANDDSGLYESVSEPKHRRDFLQAVSALKTSLEGSGATLIFCHRGLSRSPLVAAAALNLINEESTEASLGRVRNIHPSAQFTDVGLSAIAWCRTQLS